MQIKINCKFDKMVKPQDLKKHPKNRNKHSLDQIEKLAQLYEIHGVRIPIIVSNQSGFIVSGHARKEAAIKANMKTFPVVYQDFDNEEQEYAFIQSDNAIALWSELDVTGIALDMREMDFDIGALGIKDFKIMNTDDVENFDPNKHWEGMPEFKQDDKKSFRHVIVHFEDNEAARKFFELIGQGHTDKTKSVWFPEQQRMDTEAKRYGKQK